MVLPDSHNFYLSISVQDFLNISFSDGFFSVSFCLTSIIKILKFVKENGNEKEKSKIFSLVENDEDMRKFIEYIDEYYTC